MKLINSLGIGLLAIVGLLGTSVYMHPRAHEIGDAMPILEGRYVSDVPVFVQNRRYRTRKEIGVFKGYDVTGDEIPEYEYLFRYCDRDGGPRLIFDVPNSRIYMDSDADLRIDAIFHYGSIENAMLPMLTTKCLGKTI